ncbi:1,4-alpha-glucan branching enzyme [Candidatus Sulfopaludibacter sp. SbA4]|nr:1,4-alpha-glucan branching enzyme [Candidatus Sulfopaludibacter sp. SbA4]
MTAEEIEAIVGGYHGDAFRILGPHSVRKRRGQGQWEVRAFLPQAESAAIVVGDQRCPMLKHHAEGFYCVLLNGDPRQYTIHARLWDGREIDIDDPYRFGPQLSDTDLYLHTEGTLHEAYRTLGAHLVTVSGVSGVRFAVWAPNALNVTATGEFNDWDIRRHPMRRRSGGVWEIFIPGLGEGTAYKYYIRSRFGGYQQLKADPYAFYCERPPKSASVVWDTGRYQWQDAAWMEARPQTDWLKSPLAIYEVHLESWLRGPLGQPLTYRELAVKLVEYVKQMGYTHIELLPIMEHPFSGSWGYQIIAYFAPTSRFGTPDDFKYFIDCCHREGIGVLVDWVPAHFPKDAHGLVFFDGTALYEHADPRKGEQRDWGTLVFNYGRNEVRTFLISNALFWLKEYHIDGLRVDAVASMLYLDYSRKAGEWIPNQYGGNENLEAIDFLRRFNELAHQVPGAFTVAEESTAFPGVSKPVYLNGLGFTMKWNMGWMHDMLEYFSTDPIYRKFHHNHITFSLLYAFTENFVLPISHDEVVHGKSSLINKMPGDEWRQFATVRAFLAYMWAHPGKKLLFMGQEIGQREEWNHDRGIRWELLEFDPHRKLQALVRELNRLYRASPALYQVDFHHTGFEWVDFHDWENSVIAFLRRGEDPADYIVVCCNFTPVVRKGYEFGVPEEGFYEEILNTDSELFGGSNVGNGGMVTSTPTPRHGRPHSIAVTLPPLAVVAFRKR